MILFFSTILKLISKTTKSQQHILAFHFNTEAFIKRLWIQLYSKLTIISKKENLKHWFSSIKNDNRISFGNLSYGCRNKNLEKYCIAFVVWSSWYLFFKWFTVNSWTISFVYLYLMDIAYSCFLKNQVFIKYIFSFAAFWIYLQWYRSYFSEIFLDRTSTKKLDYLLIYNHFWRR